MYHYRFGPLINYWTARFEAKHKYFKQLANVMGNFTNICYSLATRHQLYQCYLALSSSKHMNVDVEIGPGTYVRLHVCTCTCHVYCTHMHVLCVKSSHSLCCKEKGKSLFLLHKNCLKCCVHTFKPQECF